jgi:tRNA threonylcarbamoyladenosine biosynthesis protein TsaB
MNCFDAGPTANSFLLMTASMLLAVETSGLLGSFAITDGSQLLLEHQLNEGQRNAQSLVAEVDRAFRALNLAATDIQTVAVSIGPGSFTGLRVGLTFAKTFAWLNQAKLVAVDTLQAIALQAPAHVETVTAVIDAQRGELFAATYRQDVESDCRILANPVGVTTQNAILLDHPLTGPGLLKLRPEVAAVHRLLDSSFWDPRAASIAKLGTRMVEAQQFSSPEMLEPVYIRLSYAEEKRVSNSG